MIKLQRYPSIGLINHQLSDISLAEEILVIDSASFMKLRIQTPVS